ncbi:MAG: hypothetical protein AABY14_04285, partial [Nanoarchaeota archaeon]
MCDVVCGDCTFKGETKSNDTTKRPSSYCTLSKANPTGGGCKWISDNTTLTGGYCIEKGEKTCDDSCDRCTTQKNCANLGRTALANQSGSCKWQGTENEGSCVANIGEDVEVCWDGTDNDADTLIDCADPACFADSFCGLVSGDCFGWTTNKSCVDNNCEWMIDKWGSWCDFKGSQCWKYDTNDSTCSANLNCKWNNGTSSGLCEKDWTIAEQCTSLNKTNCQAVAVCSWSNDTWCDSSGKGSDWCNKYGGWCDHSSFKPKDCWQYTTISGCGGVTGCSWKADTWSSPHCDINWSGNCWNYYDNSSCANSGCLWRNETTYAFCDSPMDICWSSQNSQNQANCNAVSGNKCKWVSGTWGGCTSACLYSSDVDGIYYSKSACQQIVGCVWKEESGWCEEQQSQTCYNTTNYNNRANCEESSDCRWKDPGWCGPKDGFSAGATTTGGGIGGTFGADCYKYDGNQSLCTNKTAINISCGWTTATSQYCEVDWSKDCWRNTNKADCDSASCWWKNETYGVSCMNIMDQCWNNASLQYNTAACDSNQYCKASTWGGCEPKCFSNTTESSCKEQSGCRWISGWCNPSGVTDMFDKIESGAPMPIGYDGCGDGSIQASVDLCGFGMKDMGDAVGFGGGVYNFVNASVCNKEKVKSGVTEFIGAGKDTVEFFVYLDTDGFNSGSCSLNHNATAEGYEFRLRYSSVWDANNSKAIETFNAYKCDNSKWISTDIKLIAWKKIMCSDIGGPMLAIQKTDLSKFPTLYNTKSDMRIYVSTIGNTGNTSSPTDTVGPAYITPGSVDFEITDVFSYGANSAKFEDILKKGFVHYEDCFNAIDDDFDGNIDCNDWDCQYSSVCTSKGVNAQNYNDTSSPQVSGVKIEEYPDSALVMYDTNKPTNGTLEFYYNDSKCTTLNATVYDMGITKSSVRKYKLWHTADIYDVTIGYALTNDTMVDNFKKLENQINE